MILLETNENFEKLRSIILKETNFIRTGDDESYKEFLSQYSANKLVDMNADEYCLGKGSKTKNFCWWMERGLQNAFGRYSPGTARGHLIYKKRDGSFYIHQSLEKLGLEEAQRYVSRIHSAIANANDKEGFEWIDSNKKIYEKADVEPIHTMGAGRKLRVLCAYHLDSALPISSSSHLAHFLKQLGCKNQDIPSYNKPVARMVLLRKYFEKIKTEDVSELTPFNFVKALYSDELNIRPKKRITEERTLNKKMMEDMDSDFSAPLNQILYGPPGTGKTYITKRKACAIINNTNENDLTDEDLDSYDDYVRDGQIEFVTFHQSYSYEDFIEGLKAKTNEDGSISYAVEDGIFKDFCERADSKVTHESHELINLDGKKIWKMSLGNTQQGDDTVYTECLEQNYIALGYGGDIDFTGCDNREAIKQKLKEKTQSNEIADNSYTLTSVHTLKNKMKLGDLIIISDGNRKFRAIGEVTGSYQYIEADESMGFQQTRPVKWHKVFEPSLKADKLFKHSLSQMTLYELKPHAIDKQKLLQLLAPTEVHQESLPHVIIIDEINRGNISNIFGELITLIEEDKRKGCKEERSVALPYSSANGKASLFSVPSNLYIIGTMNTADRSLTQLDIALRRRFEFIEMMPDSSLLENKDIQGIKLDELLDIINQRIEYLLDRDHTIGHSYFMKVETIEDLAQVFKNKVIPLLQEYFYEDWERIRMVLNNQFIAKKTVNASQLFGQSTDGIADSESVYSINGDAFNEISSYLQIVNIDNDASQTYENEQIQ